MTIPLAIATAAGVPDNTLLLWSIRVSCLLYLAGLYGWWRGQRWAVGVSAAGFALYLVHIYLAFDQRYAWSHAVAYAETAKQTKALFGVDSGVGIYWNYLFTVLWPVTLLWPQHRWARWMHAYMLFMFFNGAIVFAKWWR